MPDTIRACATAETLKSCQCGSIPQLVYILNVSGAAVSLRPVESAGTASPGPAGTWRNGYVAVSCGDDCWRGPWFSFDATKDGARERATASAIAAWNRRESDDTKRLDKLEAIESVCLWRSPTVEKPWAIFGGADLIAEGETLRAALDAARKGE